METKSNHVRCGLYVWGWTGFAFPGGTGDRQSDRETDFGSEISDDVRKILTKTFKLL